MDTNSPFFPVSRRSLQSSARIDIYSTPWKMVVGVDCVYDVVTNAKATEDDEGGGPPDEV
jgi:hypothetical protein